MQPAYKIIVNGSDITALIADRLISLTITDEAGVKSDRMELSLDDRDQRLAIPPAKATASVWIGYMGAPLVDKGTYIIEEIEVEGPERKMVFRGNATGLSKGSGAAREKSWDKTTLGSIARTIAGKHGWKPAISSEMDSIEYDHVDQQENDLQFLTRLAAENDGVAKVVKGRLIVSEHASGSSTGGKELPRVTINSRDVDEWSMVLTERGQYSGVKAMYHDLKKGKRGSTLSGDEDDNTHTLPHTFPTHQSAQRAAKSKHNQLKRNKGGFNISRMVGNPHLVAEANLNAVGFRVGVDGDWSISQVTHSLTDTTYITAVRCEVPTAKAK